MACSCLASQCWRRPAGTPARTPAHKRTSHPRPTPPPPAQVELGDEVAVMEAMKMRMSLRAEQEGRVEQVFAAAGDVLQADQQLVKLG